MVYGVSQSCRIWPFFPGRTELINFGILRLQLSSHARATATPVRQRELRRALEWPLDPLLIQEGSRVLPVFSNALLNALLALQETGNKHPVPSSIDKCTLVSSTCVFIYIFVFASSTCWYMPIVIHNHTTHPGIYRVF